MDPRLIIGLLLVAGSVAGVVAVISANDDTVVVYAARATLTPGDRVDVADLQQRSVRLDDATELYLDDSAFSSDGLVITRAVEEGELVPASAVGSVDGLRLTSVVLTVDDGLAASVESGAVVDVWSAKEGDGGQFGAPAVLVPAAEVVRLVESEAMVAGAQTVAVEVLVPKSSVAAVLEAVANDDALSIVPTNLPRRS